MSKSKKATRIAAIPLEIKVLQDECGELTGHDLNNGNQIQTIGHPWFKYGDFGTSYVRFLNAVCRCNVCGKTFIASRVDNDRTDKIGPWEEGVRGRSYH